MAQFTKKFLRFSLIAHSSTILAFFYIIVLIMEEKPPSLYIVTLFIVIISILHGYTFALINKSDTLNFIDSSKKLHIFNFILAFVNIVLTIVYMADMPISLQVLAVIFFIILFAVSNIFSTKYLNAIFSKFQTISQP